MIERVRLIKSASDDHAALIDALAALDKIAYEKRRRSAKDRLGIRMTVLDQEVSKRRAELLHDEESTERPVEPWDQPVNGARLLNDLANTIARHLVMTDEQYDAVALWILHAHCHDAASHSPFLIAHSATKECGKTTFLDLISRVLPRPWPTSNPTAASIYHEIENHGSTLLLDEAHTWLESGNMRGILNSGHKRSGARKTVAKNVFSTWTPKAIGLIGRVHPELESRAIRIELVRKLPTEKVEPLEQAANAYIELLRKCLRFKADNFDSLKRANADATVQVPSALTGRVRDNWLPLLAIAEQCGGKWPKWARKAARVLSAASDDHDPTIVALKDLHDLFDATGDRELTSARIVAAFNEQDHGQWAEIGLTKQKLSRLFFNLKIRTVALSKPGRPKGYRRSQFENVFSRYLSSTFSTSATRPPPSANVENVGNVDQKSARR